MAGTSSLLCLYTMPSPMGSLLIIHIRVSLRLLSSVGKIEFCCPWDRWRGREGFSRGYGGAFRAGHINTFEMIVRYLGMLQSKLALFYLLNFSPSFNMTSPDEKQGP